jgi:hypothetical protein
MLTPIPVSPHLVPFVPLALFQMSLHPRRMYRTSPRAVMAPHNRDLSPLSWQLDLELAFQLWVSEAMVHAKDPNIGGSGGGGGDVGSHTVSVS